MTFRERLADWISGGAVTRAKDARAFWESLADQNAKSMIRCASRNMRLDEALDQIAAMETPKANATVRRMAKIAREAMG